MKAKELQEQISEKMKEIGLKDSDLINGHKGDMFDTENDEPQIFFLGTASMKPSQYRGASAIYVFRKGYGILMDCAEGSYT